MNIDNKICDLYKEKGFSREALGILVGTLGAVIVRYEREGIMLSIDGVKKMADAFDFLDYLIGRTFTMVKDKKCFIAWSFYNRLAKRNEILFCKLHNFLQLNQN